MRKCILLTAVALLLGLASIVFVAIAPTGNTELRATDLLVPQTYWQGVAETVHMSEKETFDLPGGDNSTVVRTWTEGRTDIDVRQEVTKARNSTVGRMRFSSDDPTGSYRKDFPFVDERAASLWGADSIKLLCVQPNQGRCAIFVYWLRYDQFLVMLSVQKGLESITAEVAEAAAAALDTYVARALGGA